MNQTLCASVNNNQCEKCRGCILVISQSKRIVSQINKSLLQEGFAIVSASKGEEALNLLSSEAIDFVFIDANFLDTTGGDLVRAIRLVIGDQFTPMVVLASLDDESLMSDYITAGCDDFLFKPFTDTTLKYRIASMEQMQELKYLYESSINEQVVAKRVLANALAERSLQLDEVRLLSKSAAIFSGDLFLTARHPDGSLHVLIADFTGHGLSAAIGVLPVADIFNVMTEKGFSLDKILYNINKKLHALLPASMFMACGLLKIENDLTQVSVWNGGMPELYIRDHATGDIKHTIKSTHIALGIDVSLQNRFKVQTFAITPGDELLLYTDGLTDAMNADGEMFGSQRLEQCIKNNNGDTLHTSIVKAFTEFCGVTPTIDDVTLACIPCSNTIVGSDGINLAKNIQMTVTHNRDWSWYMELSGSSLQDVNPVPIAINEIVKMSGASVPTKELSDIMHILYKNATEHDFTYENSSFQDDCVDTDVAAKTNINNFVRIGIRHVVHQSSPALLISMENSGKSLSQKELEVYLDEDCHEEPLFLNVNNMSGIYQSGNRLEAILCEEKQCVC